MSTETPTAPAAGTSIEPSAGQQPVLLELVSRGGALLLGGRLVGYTTEGAVSAVPGGPIDPTIMPEGFQTNDLHPETPPPAPEPEPEPEEDAP